jgi:hypothetical protein
LPKTDKPCRQIALFSSLVPHFILEYHSFQTYPSTPILNKLCDVIQTLHAMAQYRPHNKQNINQISGERHLIGFRPANDSGNSRGTSECFFSNDAVFPDLVLMIIVPGIHAQNKLTLAETAEDDSNWAKLQSHNDFLAGRMEAISQTAYLKNQSLMQDYRILNWSQEKRTEMKREDCDQLKFATNVSVTYNNFYNETHQDKKDLNGWTYSIFAYIDKSTGKPIPPN